MDTHESTTEVSANQMLRDVMNMPKEADESVRHCISRILWPKPPTEMTVVKLSYINLS